VVEGKTLGPQKALPARACGFESHPGHCTCPEGTPEYEHAFDHTYPRYNFSNASADMRKLFCDACELLGIDRRVMNERNISVARRASVARLGDFVGPKR
jgi:hypothetical protein